MSRRPPAERAYEDLVRHGTRLSAVAGCVTASLVGAVTFGGLPSDLSGAGIFAGGVFGASAAMAGLFRVLVPRNRRFSIALAALAGLLASLAGHLSAWIGFSAAMLMLSEPQSLTDLVRALGLVPVMSAISVLLIGKFTLPLGVLIAVGVALWCRRRAAWLAIG